LYRELIEKRSGIDEFVTEKWSDFDFVSNVQTRFISGDILNVAGPETLEAAKRNLQADFAVVGLTERFDETVILLKRALGWRRPFHIRMNVTPRRRRVDKLRPEIIEIIRSKNALDLELYNFAVSLFEQRLQQEGHDFFAEVAAFKKWNKVVSPGVRFLAKFVWPYSRIRLAI